MALPHFSNIQSHNANWEPVYKNLFEVEIFLPAIIANRHTEGTRLLMENATSAKIPTYPPLTAVDQRYKYSTRLYMGFPSTTSLQDCTITFNINQNDSKQMFTFRMIKDWYDLLWNNEDGSSHYKEKSIGTIILYQHDREGEIIRRITFHNCQIMSFTDDGSLAWSDTGTLLTLSATWAADYWEDYYF